VNMGASASSGSGETVQRSERRSGYMETVTALFRLMFNGEAPEGVRREARAGQATRVGPFELRVVETYEVANLRGQVLAIRNASEATVPVVVDSFLVAGVMAAAADRVVQATARLVREHHLTALMVTHSLAQAATLGDRLLLIHRGRIVLDVQGTAKRRLSADDLAYRFDRLRSADQLDESAAQTLTALYV